MELFNINRLSIETLAKTPNSKSILGKSNNTLYDSFKLCIMNLIDTNKDHTLYDMSHWITHIDRWIQNKNFNNTTSYGRGAIVQLDLGAQNFRYEPSYTHPCIVYFERKNSILVIPCSSKKFGHGYPEIIDAGTANGFLMNTGVQTESYRWVNKNRVISVIGKVDSVLLDAIDTRMLSMIPTYRKEIQGYNAIIMSLNQDISDLKQKLEAIQTVVDVQDKERHDSEEPINEQHPLTYN